MPILFFGYCEYMCFWWFPHMCFDELCRFVWFMQLPWQQHGMAWHGMAWHALVYNFHVPLF
jgi:hypothetical protein